jgi:hypothetical protein
MRDKERQSSPKEDEEEMIERDERAEIGKK